MTTARKKPTAMQRRRERLTRDGWEFVTVELSNTAAKNLAHLQRNGATQSEVVEAALNYAMLGEARIVKGWRGEAPIEAGERRTFTDGETSACVAANPSESAT